MEQGERRMTEEEYFRKNYPDSCYGDKPLSPHWDFFQDGVEFGERQSEKKIAKLERRIASIRGSHRVDLAKLNARIEQVERLKKENAELKEKYAKNITDCDICDTYCNSQLNNAKEIINDCVCELQNILFYKMRNKERIASTLDKAEQFLNSEVEK